MALNQHEFYAPRWVNLNRQGWVNLNRPRWVSLNQPRWVNIPVFSNNGTKRLQNGELLQVSRGGYGEYGRRTNIWEYNIGKGHSTGDSIAFEHPAIFPEKLARDHIFTWSNPGDLVYDPMMGSGTVAKMCLLEERNYIGSEINKDYCKIAEQRLSNVRNTIKILDDIRAAV